MNDWDCLNMHQNSHLSLFIFLFHWHLVDIDISIHIHLLILSQSHFLQIAGSFYFCILMHKKCREPLSTFYTSKRHLRSQRNTPVAFQFSLGQTFDVTSRFDKELMQALYDGDLTLKPSPPDRLSGLNGVSVGSWLYPPPRWYGELGVNPSLKPSAITPHMLPPRLSVWSVQQRELQPTWYMGECKACHQWRKHVVARKMCFAFEKN